MRRPNQRRLLPSLMLARLASVSSVVALAVLASACGAPTSVEPDDISLDAGRRPSQAAADGGDVGVACNKMRTVVARADTSIFNGAGACNGTQARGRENFLHISQRRGAGVDVGDPAFGRALLDFEIPADVDLAAVTHVYLRLFAAVGNHCGTEACPNQLPVTLSAHVLLRPFVEGAGDQGADYCRWGAGKGSAQTWATPGARGATDRGGELGTVRILDIGPGAFVDLPLALGPRAAGERHVRLSVEAIENAWMATSRETDRPPQLVFEWCP